MNKKKFKGVLDKRVFMSYRPCKTYCWLKTHKPTKEETSMPDAKILLDGRRVEKMALALFSGYVRVDSHAANPAKTTRNLIRDGKTRFVYKGFFTTDKVSCKCDIIEVTPEGLVIYEIKSGTHTNGRYKRDVAFQKMVLEDLGYTVKETNLVLLDQGYKREGKLDYKAMFQIIPVDEWLDTDAIRESVREIMVLFPKKPEAEICDACNNCGFYSTCFHHLPKPSVFDISRVQFHTKKKWYEKGIVTLEDYMKLPPEEQMDAVSMQIEALHREEPMIREENLRAFLEELSYPLGFLDFETITPVAPQFDGFGPYESVVTQYSYHRITSAGGAYSHTAFLGNGIDYPEEELAKTLLSDTKEAKTVLMYSPTERILIQRMAERLPHLKEELLALADKLRDLEYPFLQMDYYQKELHGKSSIKQVLPTLYPNDPTLDYSRLAIHDGAAANGLYEALAGMTEEKREQTRQDLLTYCCLDTWAMVKIWEKLKLAVGMK